MSETTCPVFHPTPKQFSDLRRYVETIEKDNPDIGICKIIPPVQVQLSTEDQARYGFDNIDIPIDIPIKQHVEGGAGVYHVYNLITRAMSVKKFYEDHVDGINNPQSMSHLTASSDTAKDASKSIGDSQSHEYNEKKFWKSLGTGVDPVYGADIVGSLFTSDDPWSFDKVLSNDLLRMLPFKINGVNTSMLYFGSFRALFAYHVEDYDLYSINYLHSGACKSWYSIPPSHRSRFECFADSYFSQELQQCREYLRHKTKLFSPTKIRQAGIKHHTVVQHPGEIVITFPSAFHAGFNHGFNIAEASNFATPRWLSSIAQKAKRCICHPDTVQLSIDYIESNYKEVKAATAASKNTSSSRGKGRNTKKRVHDTTAATSSIDINIDMNINCMSPVTTKKAKRSRATDPPIKSIAVDLTTVYKSSIHSSGGSNEDDDSMGDRTNRNGIGTDDDDVKPLLKNRFLCICRRYDSFLKGGGSYNDSSSTTIHRNDRDRSGNVQAESNSVVTVAIGDIFCCRQCRYYAHVSCIKKHNHQEIATLCHLCYAMADDASLDMNDYYHSTVTQRKRRFAFHYIQTPFSRPVGGCGMPASIDPTDDYGDRSSFSSSFVTSFSCEGEQYRSNNTYAVDHRAQATVKSSSDCFDYSIDSSSSDGQDDSHTPLRSIPDSSKRQQVMYYSRWGHVVASYSSDS